MGQNVPVPSHQLTWNVTGGSWKTILLLKGTAGSRTSGSIGGRVTQTPRFQSGGQVLLGEPHVRASFQQLPAAVEALVEVGLHELAHVQHLTAISRCGGWVAGGEGGSYLYHATRKWGFKSRTPSEHGFCLGISNGYLFRGTTFGIGLK